MVLIRHATPAEMEDLAGFTVDDPVGSVDTDRFREEAVAGRVRPEWTWFAADGSRIVACALWWGRADSKHPVALDCLHVLPEVPDRAALLSRGHAEFGAAPEFNLMLRTGWRDDPSIAAAVAWRADAARTAGLTDVVERLRYEWTPAAGVPGPSGRLVFRPGEDEEFLTVFRRVAVGSLDVTTQRVSRYLALRHLVTQLGCTYGAGRQGHRGVPPGRSPGRPKSTMGEDRRERPTPPLHA